MDAIRQLATQLRMGNVLPGLKFFEPTQKFVGFMRKNYPKVRIYDVGAGMGHVAYELRENGLKALALDINHRESKENFPVTIADGESYLYLPGSVVMLCRPCHGQFSEEVILNAVHRKVSAILYVGLEKNLFGDLGIRLKKFKLKLSGAGLGGEDVWVWKIKETA